MRTYQNSPVAAEQVYQSVKTPLHDDYRNKHQQEGAKRYFTYVEQQNNHQPNNPMKMSVQPYFQQTKSNVGSVQSSRVSSANIRSNSQKNQSLLINSHFFNTEKKQTIILNTINNSSLNKLTQLPTYSSINQGQSTKASQQMYQSNTNGNYSQQLPFTIPQMSQILSNSQLSQSQSTRTIQPTNTIIVQKSQFITSSKNKQQQDSSSFQNEKYLLDSVLYAQHNQQVEPFEIDYVKDEEESEHTNTQQKQQLHLKIKRDSPTSNGGADHEFISSEDHSLSPEKGKLKFYKAGPLQKQLKNTAKTPVNFGDQQVSMEQESMITMTTLQQSAMIESGKIRERSLGSANFDIKGTRLTKRLLDLQEPRNIVEEEEEDTQTSCKTSRVENGYERSQSQQFESKKNPEYNQKYKKYSCDIKHPQDQNTEVELEYDGNHLNVEEFTSQQKPPSMASINNQQMNRDWSNSKSPKDRRISNATTSIDYRSAQATNETLQSFYHHGRSTTSNNLQMNGLNTVKKLPTQLEVPDLNDYQPRERRSSSAGNLSELIPDEPEKTQMLKLFYLTESRNPIVKLSEINQNKIPEIEKYFIPQLLKCFRGEKDKLSSLYKQYFQKIYYNLQVNPKLDMKFHQISPVFLPPLTSNKKTIFFDLDETLIHCIDIFTDPQQYQQFTQSNMTTKNSAQQLSRNSESCNEVFCTIQCSPYEQIQCLFSIRPYAQQILQELAKDFELILLTAARKIYADAVLEKLDPQNKIFSHRFYRECCIEFQIPNPQQCGSKKSYLKDLRVFQNRKIENVILVDNSPLSFLNQIPNGIPILDYCNNNKHDEELLHLCSYLKTLANVSDVRESIKNKFLLKQYKAFQSIENLQNYIISEYSN